MYNLPRIDRIWKIQNSSLPIPCSIYFRMKLYTYIYIYVTIIIYSIPPSKCKLLDLSPTNYHQPGAQVTLLKAKLAGG